MRSLAAAVVLVAAGAWAQCLRAEVVCLCAQPTAFVVKAHSADGKSAMVTEVFLAPDAGSDGGTAPAVGSSLDVSGTGISSGDWFLMDDEPRRFVLQSDGTRAVCSNVTVAADDWARAVADGSCSSLLSAGGFKQPECHDTGGPFGCATPGVALVAVAALVLGLWRRKN